MSTRVEAEGRQRVVWRACGNVGEMQCLSLHAGKDRGLANATSHIQPHSMHSTKLLASLIRHKIHLPRDRIVQISSSTLMQ